VRPAVVLAVVLVGCGGGVDVTYRRAQGEVRTYVRSYDVEGSNPNGVQARVRQEVRTKETALEVLRGEQATVQVDLERIVVELFRGGPEALLRMDTDLPPPPEKTPETEAEKFAWSVGPLRHVAGSRVEADQAFTGRILEFGGVDDLRKKVLAALPEGDARREFMERMPWEMWLANLLAPAIGVPARGMKVGAEVPIADMRTLPETTGTGGFLYYTGTCRLVKVEEGLARLEMESKVHLDPQGSMPPWPPAMAERRKFLRLKEGVARAWATVRVETGALEEEEHVTELDLHFLKPGGKGEVPIPTKITLRSKLVR
jgi:hypothetical protein